MNIMLVGMTVTVPRWCVSANHCGLQPPLWDHHATWEQNPWAKVLLHECDEWTMRCYIMIDIDKTTNWYKLNLKIEDMFDVIVIMRCNAGRFHIMYSSINPFLGLWAVSTEKTVQLQNMKPHVLCLHSLVRSSGLRVSIGIYHIYKN